MYTNRCIFSLDNVYKASLLYCVTFSNNFRNKCMMIAFKYLLPNVKRNIDASSVEMHFIKSLIKDKMIKKSRISKQL